MREQQQERSERRGKVIAARSILAVLSIGLLVTPLAYFARIQDSVRSHCDQLFEDAILARLEKLENPHLEEDQQAEFERRQWTTIIEQTTESLLGRKRFEPTSPVTQSARFVSLRSPIDDSRRFWSFRRLQRPSLPTVSDQEWIRNPIDGFILSRLEDAGLTPAQEATRRVLGRRLWYDLIGLPPTPAEIEAFIRDDDPSAYENTVTDLVHSEAFGERWARTWLDVARYADSNGYEEDELRPHAYPYRDFVIWAMNHDLPYDQFVRWQLAGDELDPRNPLAVAATGFLTAAPYNTFLPQESERRDELDDVVSTIGRAMLGLSVGCARCHDHMYDPISTEEYYGLIAIFSETERQHRYLVPNGGMEYLPIDERRQEIWEIQKARVTEDKISALDFSDEDKDLLRQPIDMGNQRQALLLAMCDRCRLVMNHEISADVEPLPKDQRRYQQLRAEIAELEASLPPSPPKGLCITGSKISTTSVLKGGRSERKGRKVGPGFLSCLTRGEPRFNQETWTWWSHDDSQTPRPRSALANWMTDVENGAGCLLARVLVNRLWQHHFGTGLVSTPSDFGAEGEAPTHPELLEWLACELVESGWRLKHIHKLIVTSSTYRQSERRPVGQGHSDAARGLYAGRAPQRLTAEMFWDALLATGGNLNRTMYGPGVFVPLPKEAIFNKEDQAGLVWPVEVRERPAIWRRGIYVIAKRTNPVPLLRLHDAPDAGLSCAARKVTTVPTQALALMNGVFVRKQAKRLAQRVLTETRAEANVDATAAVRAVFLHTLSRPPSSQESDLCVDFLHRRLASTNSLMALTDFCHTMLMCNEFIYVN